MDVKLAALALLASCSSVTDSFVTNTFSGDPYPIQIETDSGAIVVGMRQDGSPDRAAVLDVMSPVTLADPGPAVAPAVTNTGFLLLGQRGPGGALDLPRAFLGDVDLLTLHPCEDPTCVVGTETAPRPYDALIGADALAGDAVRLRLSDHQMFVLADVAGDEFHRSHACDAVFPSPYRGGGTLVIGGTERAFAGRRIAVQACLGANPDPLLPQGLRGADALLVMSTSIGISIIAESMYARYRTAHPTAPTLETLPFDSVFLPSGLTTGRHATIDVLALVASSSTTPRAPCRQVYGSHLLVNRDCINTGDTPDDCPCERGTTFCAMPAVVELAPTAGIDVLVVADSDANLQALRTELRPDQAEVDGILGTAAIQSLEIDVDYPHDRVLARCATEDCRTRPELDSTRSRPQIQGCLEGGPVAPP